MNQIDKNKEMLSLKAIINERLGLNMSRRVRKRPFVNARIIYSKILRDRGYAYKLIGKSLDKDHSTIINYMVQCSAIIKQDEKFAEDYVVCRDAFFKENTFVTDLLTDTKLITQIVNLTEDNRVLIMERERVLKLESKYRRLKSIIDFIDKKTSEGGESVVEFRIKQLFNENYRD